MSWVDARHGDASHVFNEQFDAIVVNAGVTHPLDAWLDALAPGGRMVLPLTGTLQLMGSNIGKGLVFVLTNDDRDSFSARVLTVVAIYSAIGVRDDKMNDRLGKAMMGGPTQWQTVKRLRRDAHEPDASCWLHGPTFCISTLSNP
jgi:protein-L-isoaspartate(D-aspartate) O-methyltransferase